jgi:hypothetical protein
VTIGGRGCCGGAGFGFFKALIPASTIYWRCCGVNLDLLLRANQETETSAAVETSCAQRERVHMVLLPENGTRQPAIAEATGGHLSTEPRSLASPMTVGGTKADSVVLANRRIAREHDADRGRSLLACVAICGRDVEHPHLTAVCEQAIGHIRPATARTTISRAPHGWCN